MNLAGQSCTLILKDQMTEKTYSLYLNKLDYDRALEDNEFASVLLQHAKQAEEDESIPEESPIPTIADIEETELGQHTRSADKWSYDATLCLIASMHNYMGDFGHPKKRRLIWSNVSNEVLSKGFSFSEISCKNKFKSLERTYKVNKDRSLKTGQGSSRFFFFAQLDELLGSKPANKNCDSMESSSDTTVSNVDASGLLDDGVRLSVDEPALTNRSYEERRGVKRTLSKEARKQKRHDERLAMEREKLEVEREKVQTLKSILEKLP